MKEINQEIHQIKRETKLNSSKFNLEILKAKNEVLRQVLDNNFNNLRNGIDIVRLELNMKIRDSEQGLGDLEKGQKFIQDEIDLKEKKK